MTPKIINENNAYNPYKMRNKIIQETEPDTSSKSENTDEVTNDIRIDEEKLAELEEKMRSHTNNITPQYIGELSTAQITNISEGRKYVRYHLTFPNDKDGYLKFKLTDDDLYEFNRYISGQKTNPTEMLYQDVPVIYTQNRGWRVITPSERVKKLLSGNSVFSRFIKVDNNGYIKSVITEKQMTIGVIASFILTMITIASMPYAPIIGMVILLVTTLAMAAWMIPDFISSRENYHLVYDEIVE